MDNWDYVKEAAARSRMFGNPRFDYLRNALFAARMLTTSDADYLNRMGNRAYYQRVRDGNVLAYLQERAKA